MFSVIPKTLLATSIAQTNKFILSNNKYDLFGMQLRTKSTTVPNPVSGINYVRDPQLNKGLAFSLMERQALHIHGLLAPSFKTMEEQLAICTVSIDRYKNPLNKYLYLAELYDTNERLFFTLLSGDIAKYMPIIYTPTVGLACQKFGLAYRKPRGLFITIHDRGNILKILENWPEDKVKAICVTDGERILGLGDLGAYGMGIPIGKLALYTVLGGVVPGHCLPIVLDVGTNNEKLITDPLYIGIRQKRVAGKEYYDFVEEFMGACIVRFGSNILIQFEDFALPNATPLLLKYQDRYCTFNDDIQGTASVAVAGLLAAVRITNMKVTEMKLMFLGAGSAATGIGNLTVDAMVENGMAKEEAQKRIYMFDVDGFLSKKREKPIPDHAMHFAHDMPPETNFEKILGEIKPNVLIGVSTVGGAFTPKIIKMMATFAERPIIFACSNPTSKAECTPQEAYDNTEGRCVYASGSPFPPVQYGGKTYITGQGNNAYIFPGLALGVMCAAARTIPDVLFLHAAKTCANLVTEKELEVGLIYPPVATIRELSKDIALAVAEKCFEIGIATTYPKPPDLKSYILSHRYSLTYPSYLVDYYDYPPCNVTLKSVSELYPSGKIQSGPAKEEPKLDVNDIVKEVEKSKIYFDTWMCVVQAVYYYVLVNPIF